jgi:tetratricopeptide (TPR) repeat protein
MIAFDGRDIRVIARLFDSSRDELVVTFTGRQAVPQYEIGFGENYLKKRKISALHFASKDNHWWQTPEAHQAIALFKSQGLIGPGKRITLYGSSMGGYAALILSRAFKASRVVAFSPQYSIDAKRVPFESRWRAYADKLSFDFDDMAAGIDPDADIKAVFDPFFEPDRKHVELVESHRPIERVPVCFAGHNTARVLEELGIITSVIDSLLLGDFNRAGFQEQYRALRPASSLFWYGLADALSKHRHDAGALFAITAAAKIMMRSGRMRNHVLRLDILRRAIALAAEADMPDLARTWLDELETIEKSGYRVSLARSLVAKAAGDWPRAEKLVDAILPKHGDNAEHLAFKAEALIHNGGPAAAIAFVEKLPPRIRRKPPIQLALAQAQAAERRWDDTLHTLQGIFRQDPDNAFARTLCVRGWSALGRPDVAEKQFVRVMRNDIASARLAGEVVKLLEAGRSKAAGAVGRRHSRYAARLKAMIAALDMVDWSDTGGALAKLRADLGPDRARRPAGGEAAA